jgi:tetratricopeptide (TPR) repeat protein
MEDFRHIVVRPRRWYVLLLILTFCLGSGPAGASPGPEPHAAATRLARQGVNALLDVQLDRANAIFDSLQQKYPDYPLSGFLHASVYWVRAEAAHGAEQRKARAMGIKRLEQAITQAKEALKKTPDDPYWRLDLGMSLFFAARLYHDQGEILVTYNYARHGRDELRDLLKTHPEMEDAYFVLGMYEYIAGSVPPALHWLTVLFDISGSRRLGVKYLERATAHAPLMAPEAARILLAAAAIQPEYNRPCDYRPLAIYMYDRFNGNPYFSMALQLIDAHCGYPKEALALNVIAHSKYLPHYPNLRGTLRLVELQAYRSLGDLKHIDAMKPKFIKHDPAFWYLARAQALDLNGQRAKAMKIYEDLHWASLYPSEYPAMGKVPDWVADQVKLNRKVPFSRIQPKKISLDASPRLQGVSPAAFRSAIDKFKVH